jgi:hypothetical protein
MKNSSHLRPLAAILALPLLCATASAQDRASFSGVYAGVALDNNHVDVAEQDTLWASAVDGTDVGSGGMLSRSKSDPGRCQRRNKKHQLRRKPIKIDTKP